MSALEGISSDSSEAFLLVESSKDVSFPALADARTVAALSLFVFARFLTHPVWKTTSLCLKTVAFCNEKQNGAAQKAAAIAKTVIASLALLPFSIGGLVVGQVVHLSGFLLAPTPYFHLQGETQKDPPKNLSAFQLNCCVTAGGFSLLFGGIPRSNEERVQQLAAEVRRAGAPVVGLQEVSDLWDALALCRALASDFAEFCIGIGMTPWVFGNNSGLFVASQGPITQAEFFSFSHIPGTETFVNKGCFSLFTLGKKWLNTHFSPSANDRKPTVEEIGARRREQELILQKEADFVMGDLNIVYGGDEYRESPLFQRFHAEPQQQPTCNTEFLIDRNLRRQESAEVPIQCDYFLHRDSEKVVTECIATSEEAHPEEALSDHAILLSRIQSA